MKRAVLILIALCLMASCGTVGLNNDARNKIEEVQRQVRELNDSFQGAQSEIQGLRNDIRSLNQSLVELKVLAPSVVDLTAVMTRVANALESLNQQLVGMLGLKRFISP